MKIIGAYKSKSGEPTTGMNILVWPDSTMIRSGKPLFVPDDGFYMFCIGFGAKIKSVGKSISARFASKYYDEVAPMAFLFNSDVARQLLAGEDPAATAIVADYTVICGDFIPRCEEPRDGVAVEISVTPLPTAEKSVEPASISLFMKDIEGEMAGAIVRASIHNTLKTGDIVAFLTTDFIKAFPETLLKVGVDGKLLIENKLK